jgi:hypothetical protein
MDLFVSNIWVVAPVVWAGFVVYVVWFSTRAKRFAPLTVAEARQLWTIHRQNAGCSSSRWRQVKFHGRTIGFECGCGHRHVQKRPIVSSPPSSVSTRASSLKTLKVSREG